MKHKKAFILIGIALFITLIISVMFDILLFQKISAEPETGDPPASGNRSTADVSVIELIATPEKYDGKLIRVIGVGSLEDKKNCIALSKDDLKYGAGNSIWLQWDRYEHSYDQARQYNGKYVIVEGVFDKDDCGYKDMFHGSIKEISRYELWDSYIIDHSTIAQQADLTYSYEITDYNGRILYYSDTLTKEPKRQHADTDVVGMCIQAGTGLSTNNATYFDLEYSKISETFHYVLAAKNGYVVYADPRDGEHFIVVRDIFDKEEYYQEYKLENVSPVAADAVIDGYFNAKGNINITYLSGEDHTETNYTIVMLPKGNLN